MINLHEGYCRFCGPSLFGRRKCVTCGRPVSAEAPIRVKEVHKPRKQKLQGHGAELGRGALSVPLPEQSRLFEEE